MADAHALLGAELEDALRHISLERCADALGRIADLFIVGASRFTDEHVDLFDRVMERLIGAAEPAALAALARRFAPVRNAPPGIVRRLAYDDHIAIAGPVLARAGKLADADLIAIASTASQAHKFAISGRTTISQAVADALVDCGDRDVARNLAMNHGARLAGSGMAMLAARAINDRVLADKLTRRPDMPPQVIRIVLRVASPEVRRHVLAAAPHGLREELQDVPSEPDTTDAVEHVEAWRTVRALQRAGRLDETRVLELAESGRTRAAMAAVAVICATPIELVRQLMNGCTPDAALIFCQAAGFSWAGACEIVLACATRSSSRSGSRTVEAMLAEIEGLSAATAERIVEFWRAAA